MPEKAPAATLGFAATIATLTLTQINALIGCTLGIVSLLCLFPLMLRRWRYFFLEFRVWRHEFGGRGFFRDGYSWLFASAGQKQDPDPPFSD